MIFVCVLIERLVINLFMLLKSMFGKLLDEFFIGWSYRLSFYKVK